MLTDYTFIITSTHARATARENVLDPAMTMDHHHRHNAAVRTKSNRITSNGIMLTYYAFIIISTHMSATARENALDSAT